MPEITNYIYYIYFLAMSIIKMCPLFFYFILPLFFSSFYFKFGVMDDDDKSNSNVGKEVGRIFNPIPTNVDQFVINSHHYTKDGNLFYPGKRKGYSEEISLFFKKEKTASTPFFKIRYCLPRSVANKCVDGITICYEPQMKRKFNKQYYKDLNLRLRNDLNCSNKEHFGFKVYTDGENGEAAENFKIKATIDEHIYVFPFMEEGEENCFVISMGSNESVATTITNVQGQELIFIGDPPAKFDNNTPSLQYSNKKTMNLWMLFMDFMKFYPESFKYRELPIQFTGGGKFCKMTADFDTASLDVCKEGREFLGSCGTENLGSSDLECTFELRVSQSVEEGTERGTSQTNTNSESDTTGTATRTGTSSSDSEMLGVEDAIKVSLGGSVPGFNFGGEFEMRVKSEQTHTTGSSCEEEDSSSSTVTNERSDTMSFTQTHKEVDERGKLVNVKVHRTDGGSVDYYQAIFTCGGQTYRYHKVIAVGDKDHTKAPQSTVVYEEYINNQTAKEADANSNNQTASTVQPEGENESPEVPSDKNEH